jgi:hypothetical protein
MDEDLLIAPPFEPPTPKRQTDAELIMAGFCPNADARGSLASAC